MLVIFNRLYLDRVVGAAAHSAIAQMTSQGELSLAFSFSLSFAQVARAITRRRLEEGFLLASVTSFKVT